MLLFIVAVVLSVAAGCVAYHSIKGGFKSLLSTSEADPFNGVLNGVGKLFGGAIAANILSFFALIAWVVWFVSLFISAF